MNRYTGNAKRILAAISCAAMVISNLGSDLQTITAYADTATEQSTEQTSQNTTDLEPQTEEDEVSPVVEEENGETTEVPEETPGNSDSESDPEKQGGKNADPVEEPKEEGSEEGEEEEKKDEGEEPENPSEPKEEPSDEDKKDEFSEKEPSGEGSTEEEEIVTPKEPEITDPEEKEPEEVEYEQIDETANIRFVAEYIGYYYDYAYDEELGEETEQQFTKKIADSKTLTIDKDNSYDLFDNAPSIDDWAFDYITIDDEEYYDDAKIAIGTDKDEDNLTETLYYTINGNRVDASDETRTITVTYLYMSTKNEVDQLETSEYTLTAQYRCGTSPDKTSAITSEGITLQYSTDGGNTWTTITKADYSKFGLDEDFSLSANTTSDTADSYKVYLYPNDGNGHNYSYRLNATAATGYTVSHDDKDNLVIAKNEAQSVKVTWHDASDAYKTRESVNDYLKTLTVTGGDGSSYTATTEEKDADGNPNPNYVKATTDGNTWTITFPNLPQYDSGNNVIEYKVTTSWDKDPASTKTKDVVEGTTYKQTITNQYSNSTTEIFLEPSGKDLSEIEYSLSGKTTYTATKKWIDNTGKDTRPSVSFTLYRYPQDGTSSYQNASPEPDATVSYDSTADKDNITVSGSDKNVLDAYDTDGYLYQYIAKESMSGGSGYKLCVWKSASELGSEDVEAGQTGEYVAVDSNFIKDGETVYNVIQTTKSIEYTKNFVAKDVQDRKITVEFELQATTNTKNGNPDWDGFSTSRDGDRVISSKNDEGKLSGFTEKVTSQTGTFDGLPAEDNTSAPGSKNLGKEVFYRVVEKTVTLYDEDGNVLETVTADGTGYITLGGNRYEQIQEEPVDDGNGNSTVEITNRLVGNAEIQINKSFPDGFYTDPETKETDKSFTATFNVLRNGEKIGTVTKTYTSSTGGTTTVTKWSDLDNGSIPSGLKDKDGNVPTGELPRYDETGAEYTYSITENLTDDHYVATVEVNRSYPKYATGTAYAGEEYLLCTADAQNHINDGDPFVHVAKAWKDDSQRMYRANIGYEIRMQMTVGGETKTIASGKLGQYQTGVYHQISTASIRAAFGLSDSDWKIKNTQDAYNNWKKYGYSATAKEVTIDGKTVVVPGFSIVETSINGGITVVAAGSYDTQVSADKKNAAHKSSCDFAYASDQQYDVTYKTKTTVEGEVYDLVIVNTRIGTNKIVLDKTWTDGSDFRGKRPDTIKITVTATVDGMPANIWQDGSGRTLNPATGEISSKTAVGTAGANAANQRVYTLSANGSNVEVSDNGNHWVFTSDDLRKYDDEGRVINYTASAEYISTEGDTALADLGYTATYNETASITYGANHTNDLDTFTYQNAYVGSVDVNVNKIWEDDGSGLTRPDIYMTIFRRLKVGESNGANVYGKFDGNGNYTGVKVGETGDGSEWESLGYVDNDWTRKTQNWWYVDFTNQPRYNSQGYEWVYFVAERFTSTNTNDYTCVGSYTDVPTLNTGDTTSTVTEFKGTNQNTAYVTTDEQGNTIKIYAVQMKTSDDGKTWTSGTLVNRPVNSRDIKGTKQWSAPDGYGYENDTKPAIDVTLYRVTYKNAQKWAAMAGHKDSKGRVIWNGIFTYDGGKLVEAVTKHADTDQDGTVTDLEKPTQNLSEALGYNYEWKDVDRYDTDGGRYTYIVKEVYSDQTDKTIKVAVDDIWNQTVTDEGAVTNVFKEDQDYSIKFTKDWSVSNLDKDSIGKVPSVTITLVRYLQDQNGKETGSAEPVKIKPTNVNGSTTDTNIKVNDNGTATITFSNYPGENDDKTQARTQTDVVTWNDLPYYGTNGRPYIYKIEETSGTSLGGMEISTTQTKKDSSDLVEVTKTPTTGTVTKATVPVVDNGKDAAGVTELTNKYGLVRGVVNVEKKWIKSTDAANTLSDSQKTVVTNLGYLKNSLVANNQNTAIDTNYKVDVEHEISFDLFRNVAAKSDSSADSLNTLLNLSDTAAAENSSVLSGATGGNNWTTKITNLEMFDGEGRTYYYYVTEKSTDAFYVSQYYDQSTTYQPAVKDVAGANINTVTLTNTPKTEGVTGQKVWNTQNYVNNAWSGNINTSPDLAKLDDLGALPDSITYTIQYRISTNYETGSKRTAAENFSFSGDWSTLYEDQSKAKAVTISANIQHATKDANGNITKAGDYSYTATKANLPSYVYTVDASGSIKVYAIEYRAIETSMKLSDGSTKSVKISDRDESGLTNTNKNGSFTIGAMKASDSTTNNTTTTTNVIPVRTLKIRKIWDDELNRDKTRDNFKSLTFTIANTGNSKSTTTTVSTAVSSLPTTPTKSTENWDDNKAYANYYINHLKKNNRPINAAAVWEGSVEVPAGAAITVTEQKVDGYTTLTYNGTSWSPVTGGNGAATSIEANVTDYTVTFANRTDSKQQFNLKVYKNFTYTDKGTAVWSTGTTADANGYYTVTIPSKDESYINYLKEKGLAFQLQYSTDGTNYNPIDVDDKSLWGLGEKGTILQIHPAYFGDDNNTLTFTEDSTAGTATFLFKVKDWTNLPVNVYTDNGSKAVTYKVVEGFYKDGSFTPIKSVSDTAFTGNWDLTNSTKEVAGLNKTNATATFNNVPKFKDLTATKTWKQETYDASGTAVANSLKEADLTQLAAFNALPDTITYQVQYQYKTGNDTAWHDYTGYVFSGDKDTTYAYSGTIKDLPAYMTDASVTKEVRYRAIEKSMTFGANAEPVERVAGTNGKSDTIGAIMITTEGDPTESTTNSYSSTITNTIPVRVLTIEKLWDDEADRDKQRPDSLTFTIKRDGTAYNGSAIDSKDKAYPVKLNADNASAGVGQGYTDYVNSELKGRSLGNKSIWVDTVTVPYYRNGTTTVSSYEVTESTIASNLGYTQEAYNAANTSKWAAGNLSTTTDGVAVFANVRTKNSYNITPVKKWTYDTDRWENTTENVTTVDASFKGYFEALEKAGFAFRLRYDIGQGYKDINTSDETVKKQIGNVNPISTVKFEYSENKQDSSKLDVKMTTAGWKDLSKKWYNADTLTSTDIEYQVEEGFKLSDGSFITMADAKNSNDDTIKQLANMWTASAANYTDITAAAPKPTFTNDLVTNKIVVEKILDETSATDDRKSSEIKYQLQYRVGDSGAYQTVPNIWLRDANVENGTYDETTQLITVTRSNGTYPVVTITKLPKFTADGQLYNYRIEETDPGVGYAQTYTIDGVQQSDQSFKSAITNRYFTVNATIDKTWYDGFGLNSDVNTTVYQLQRREVSVDNTGSNALWDAALNFLGLDEEDDIPEATAWTTVYYKDMPGAKYAEGSADGTKISITDANKDDPYQVTLTVSKDGNQNNNYVTAKVSNLIGIKTVEDGYTTYYEYRFVENGMVMQGSDTGKTSIADSKDSKDTNDQLVADSNSSKVSDGGYRLVYTFTNYDSKFEPDKTFVSHVDAYIKTAKIVVTKVWNDKNNYDGVRPSYVNVFLTMDVKHDGEKKSVAFKNSKVANSGKLEESKNYVDKTTWVEVPVNDAYGDKITYTFDEGCPSDYQLTSYTAPFTTKDGKTYNVEFCNFHYVPEDGGGSDEGGDNPTPVVPKVVPVKETPAVTPTAPIEETPEEPVQDTTDRGEHYGDPAYGYFDENGNWHYYDEVGDAKTKTGDDSLMTVYAGTAAASAAILAAWFVLYRRKREQ